MITASCGVAYCYATFLGSLDVEIDDSLVGQLTTCGGSFGTPISD